MKLIENKKEWGTTMIDTHTHYAHYQYDEDRAEALAKAFDSGVKALINIAITYESNEQMREMFKEYDNIFFSVGIQPCRITEEDCANAKERLAGLKDYADWDKAVAIGETGLDYLKETEEEKREIQRQWFRHHIELALEKELPLVLHIRGEGAMKDALAIMNSYDLPDIPGVCHCFVGSPDEAEALMNMGFLFGIGGLITQRRLKDLRTSMKMIPLESILLETDCPFLAPAGYDSKRNGSDSLPLIVKVIANLKGVTEEEVIKQTTENTKKVFHKIRM